MATMTEKYTPPGPTPRPERQEVGRLLEQILACSPEDLRYLLEQMARAVLGEHPPREVGIDNEDGSPYVYILEPEHRIRLFVTPERLALWASQEPLKDGSHREFVAMLQRGDEEEVKAFLASRNS